MKEAMILLQDDEDDHKTTSSESLSTSPSIQGKTTVVIFCFNRAEYLKRTLESLFTNLDSGDGHAFLLAGVDILISQDGDDPAVAQVAQDFIKRFQAKYRVNHVQHKRFSVKNAYFALAQHYGKGLEMAFAANAERVIILEDDLLLSVDFFSYMAAFTVLLDRDDSLLCVSAWNDHGQAKFVSLELDGNVAYRTDFFPGLGWMMPKRIWKELSLKWPDSYWDDWLREPAQRQNRHCIRPAVTRTITFGSSGGASQGQFFSAYLASMVLNPKSDTTFSPSALEKDTFDREFMGAVKRAVSVSSLSEITSPTVEYKMTYTSFLDYENRLAPSLGMLNDVKANVPRGAYRGIVPIRFNGIYRLFLVPVA